MIAPDNSSAPLVAVIPFVGNEQNDDSLWVGALLARMLIQMLQAAELSVLDYNVIARQLTTNKFVLPLDRQGVASLRQSLKLHALLHGRYVLDEVGKLLGFRLMLEAPDVVPVPLEVSAPLPEFSRFMERVALSIVEPLGRPIDDDLRQKISRVPRPVSFEALRQLARAYGAWARRQNELALAAVSSTQALDPNFEEAAALEVAIARSAADTVTTKNAFRRWASIAEKQGQSELATERLLMLGHWLTERGEWDEARRAYDETRNQFQRQKNEEGEARAINDLANLELMRGKYQHAIQAYRRNLRIFEADLEFEPDRARTLYNLSIAHKNLGQHVEAERAIEEALAQARDMKDTALEAHCLIQRGALHHDAGRWAQANIDYAHAARLFEALKDQKRLAIVKTHQSIVLKHQGDYDRAEALLLQAVEAFEKLDDPHEEAVCWVNLADLYLSMGLYDQAWDYAEKALDALTQLKSGWQDRAQEIISTLESIPEQVPAVEDETVENGDDQPDDLSDISETVKLFSRSMNPTDPKPPTQMGSDEPPSNLTANRPSSEQSSDERDGTS